MVRYFLDDRLIVKTGDITEESVDAVVNAANHTLFGGGGVDGAIHARGGPAILEECRLIRETTLPKGLPTGEAVITTAGDLPARYVIHTVGPIYGQNNGRDAELLASSYKNSILLARKNGLASIAFPAISTGVFDYPKHEAAPIAAEAVISMLEQTPEIKEIRLVFFSQSDAKIFLEHAPIPAS